MFRAASAVARAGWLLLVLCLTPAHAVLAKVGTEEAAKLGSELTELGAIRAGNADGTIPEWQGDHYHEVFERETSVYFQDGGAALKKLLKGKPIPEGITEAKTITPQLLETLRQFVLREFEAFRATPEGKKQPPLHPVERGKFEAFMANVPAEYADMAKELDRLINLVGRETLDTLHVITRENHKTHADKLTVGQRAMFERYADFRMKVHPSVRSAWFPPRIREATVANATTAEVLEGKRIRGAKIGFPFPIPKTGEEVMWNHKLKFRGSTLRRIINEALVQPDGTYQISKSIQDLEFYYANLGEVDDKLRGSIFSLMGETLEPPDVAGQRLLVHENIGEDSGGREVYLYNEGVGLRQVPDAGYDTPLPQSFGELFADQADMFNGATDRYDWTLVGRREHYIPYNSFELNSPLLKYSDILQKNHVARDYTRYELHRVWVVDANLKEGMNHQLKRRTFYVDEDSWSIVAVDAYDNQDKLWRYQEAYLIPILFIGTVTGIPEAMYDLQSGRYFVSGLTNEERIPDWTYQFRKRHFSQRALKKPKIFRW